MKKVVVILGPTGVGKTKLSLEIAKKYHGEIISGDSIQVYKDVNIGSAKIKKDEMQNIPHHMIDVFKPNEECSVALFQKMVRECISRIDFPIIVGGTGLYIDSVIKNYEFNEKRDDDYLKKYDNMSNEELYNHLISLDKTINQIHPNNRKRVLRALEVIEKTGTSITQKNQKHTPYYDALILFLTTNREELYRRINIRVDEMIEEGLVDEARLLYDKNIRIHAIGYKELNSYFDGEISLSEAISEIKKNSRHYAKRQETWFKKEDNSIMIDVDYNNFDNTINKAYEIIDLFLKKEA